MLLGFNPPTAPVPSPAPCPGQLDAGVLPGYAGAGWVRRLDDAAIHRNSGHASTRASGPLSECEGWAGLLVSAPARPPALLNLDLQPEESRSRQSRSP